MIAKGVDIIALPLLVRKLPLPERRLIGDMSDEEKGDKKPWVSLTRNNENIRRKPKVEL